MKDFRGTELKVGDKVIVCGGYGSTDYLSEGVITAFTPKNIKIGKSVINPRRVVKDGS